MRDLQSDKFPPTQGQLDEFRRTDITKVDKDALVDIRSVSIDPDSPIETRFQQFFSQIRNPYAYRVGDIAVKIEFAIDGKPLADALAQYLASLKNHT